MNNIFYCIWAWYVLLSNTGSLINRFWAYLIMLSRTNSLFVGFSAYVRLLMRCDKDFNIFTVWFAVMAIPLAILWGILVYNICKSHPKSYWAFNLTVYLFPFIGIFIFPLTFGTVVADFVLSFKKLIPTKSLARNNMIIKLLTLPMYVFYILLFFLGALMSIWGIGFIIYAPVAAGVTVVVTGLYSLSAFIGIARQKSLNIPLSILAAVRSFIFFVDAVAAVAFFIWLAARAKKTAAISTVFYRVEGSGDPLVLLHGNGEDSSIFEEQIKAFREKYKVIAVDSRGHGKSPRGEGEFSLKRFADDLDDVLKAEKIRGANILGFSDGGNVALIYALKYPGKVRSLVVSGANIFPEGLKDEVLADIKREYEEADSVGKKELLALMKDEPRIDPKQLNAIRVPVLVTAGTDDMIKEEHTKLIAENLPVHELVIFEGSHFVPFEKADEYNAKVLGFLARVNGRTQEITSGRAET